MGKVSDIGRLLPEVGQLYKHYMGSVYKIVSIAVNKETGDTYINYTSPENRLSTRSLDNFMDTCVDGRHKFTLVRKTIETLEIKTLKSAIAKLEKVLRLLEDRETWEG
jgi:hypothetical protein